MAKERYIGFLVSGISLPPDANENEACSIAASELKRAGDGTIDILTLLVKAGLVPSRSEARRAVEQGGVTADGEKVPTIGHTFSEAQLREGILLRRGKKTFKKIAIQ